MSSVYKYQEIVDELTEAIREGSYRSGDQLPSMAQLRDDFGASYGSIRTAMIIMKTQGLVEGRHGVGVFVK